MPWPGLACTLAFVNVGAQSRSRNVLVLENPLILSGMKPKPEAQKRPQGTGK